MKLFDEIKPVFFIDNKMNNILNDITNRMTSIGKSVAFLTRLFIK